MTRLLIGAKRCWYFTLGNRGAAVILLDRTPWLRPRYLFAVGRCSATGWPILKRLAPVSGASER